MRKLKGKFCWLLLLFLPGCAETGQAILQGAIGELRIGNVGLRPVPVVQTTANMLLVLRAQRAEAAAIKKEEFQRELASRQLTPEEERSEWLGWLAQQEQLEREAELRAWKSEEER